MRPDGQSGGQAEADEVNGVADGAATANRIEMERTDMPGLLIVRTRRYRDERGWFSRLYCAAEYATAGMANAYVQENCSRSRQRTIRGLHVRADLTEFKTVQVTHGALFDVVVDLRPSSPTYLCWRSFTLRGSESIHLVVPPGCAHGFQVMTAWAQVHYNVTAYYDPTLDVAIAWNDEDLGIPWPLADPILSGRDRAAPSSAELRDRFNDWFGAYRYAEERHRTDQVREAHTEERQP